MNKRENQEANVSTGKKISSNFYCTIENKFIIHNDLDPWKQVNIEKLMQITANNLIKNFKRNLNSIVRIFLSFFILNEEIFLCKKFELLRLELRRMLKKIFIAFQKFNLDLAGSFLLKINLEMIFCV